MISPLLGCGVKSVDKSICSNFYLEKLSLAHGFPKQLSRAPKMVKGTLLERCFSA